MKEIIADSQEELDQIPCPSCNKKYTLKMSTGVGEGQPMRVLSEEEARKKRP